MRAANKKEQASGWLRFFTFVFSGKMMLAVMLSLFLMGLGSLGKWPVAQTEFKGMV